MRHGSLFSGIGGFDLAAQWMGWENVFQVEKDSFCQKVLAKNFPNTKRYGDIKEFDGTKYRGAVDIISGGFPCQPFSTAGKRKGTKDDRYLWPEMLRVIREVQPTCVVGENVYGLVNWSGGMVFEQVCADLENEGYQVQPVILPACGVNAPHRRDRVWFVAYSASNNDRRAKRKLHQSDGRQDGKLLSALSGTGEGLCHERTTTDTGSHGHERRGLGEDRSAESQGESEEDQRQRVRAIPERTSEEGIITDTNVEGLQGSGECRLLQEEGQNASQRSADLLRLQYERWQNFPTQPPLRDGNDGLPSNMVRRAIAAGGNAIVPQVAFEIFKAIESINQGGGR